jgi:RecA-family ATPase
MKLTERFHELEQLSLSVGAGLILVDGAAATFGGNEIVRSQVSTFVARLTKLAMEANAAVLLLAHPSRAGMSSGSGDSGSTHWNNACRSRWYMVRPKLDEKTEDETKRLLVTRKNNWGERGLTVTLDNREGVFSAEGRTVAGTAAHQDAAEAAFLEALRSKRAGGLHVSQSKRAGNYAPKVLTATPEGRDFKERDFATAMANLLKRGDITAATYTKNYETYEELVITADASKEGTSVDTGV